MGSEMCIRDRHNSVRAASTHWHPILLSTVVFRTTWQERHQLTCTTRAADGRWRTSRTRTPPPDSSARLGIDLQAGQASSLAFVWGHRAGLGEFCLLLRIVARCGSTRVMPRITARQWEDAELCGTHGRVRDLSILPGPCRGWPTAVYWNSFVSKISSELSALCENILCFCTAVLL